MQQSAEAGRAARAATETSDNVLSALDSLRPVGALLDAHGCRGSRAGMVCMVYMSPPMSDRQRRSTVIRTRSGRMGSETSGLRFIGFRVVVPDIT